MYIKDRKPDRKKNPKPREERDLGQSIGSGADRARTDDLLHAMQALSQLSYGPMFLLEYRVLESPCTLVEFLKRLLQRL